MLHRWSRELARRFREIRGPLIVVGVGGVTTAVAYVLRIHLLADVAFFTALLVFLFALDVFVSPPPGEPERGISFSGEAYMGSGDPRPPT